MSAVKDPPATGQEPSMALMKTLAVVASFSLLTGATACGGSSTDLGASVSNNGGGSVEDADGGSSAKGGNASGGKGSATAGGTSSGGESQAGESSDAAGAGNIAGAIGGNSDAGNVGAGEGGSSASDCSALACGAPCGPPGNSLQCSVTHDCVLLVSPCAPEGTGGAASAGSCAGKACGQSCLSPAQQVGVCNLAGECSVAGTPPPCFLQL